MNRKELIKKGKDCLREATHLNLKAKTFEDGFLMESKELVGKARAYLEILKGTAQ